jgi:hypothetical protein
VDKDTIAKNTKTQDIGLVATPGLLWGLVVEGSCWHYVVEKSSIFESIKPVQLREVSIGEHPMDLVKEGVSDSHAQLYHCAVVC